MTDNVYANLVEPNQARFIMMVRVPVGDLDGKNLEEYLENTKKTFQDKRLEAAGFVSFIISTRSEPFAASIIKLETMQQVVIFEESGLKEKAIDTAR